jgi:HTH-type transcriptional regulator/antitoxin HipB
MIVADAVGLGEAVRERRRQLGLTQEELADLAQVSLRSVSQLESGVSSMTFGKLLAILSVLGLSLGLEVRAIAG